MTKKKRIGKILIPNRGEIAVRIQRTCREMGIPSVAVFSEQDRHALHVRYADEAFPLAGTSARDTYLNQEKILEVARHCGADAIHPGYGFLSENASFARRCLESGLIFIGPGPEAIEVMGLKTEARRIMTRAGVPVVPGSEPLEDPAACRMQAEIIGYPVLIKAAAGGGGKGMRLVETPGGLQGAYEAARREAESAFGDPRVYLEKYLEKPRHVEFQVLADGHGNTVHLFERECSVQRRHQKIIEETPSPVLDDTLRSEMGTVAVEAARACRYLNAGTVEFLVDAQKRFYFLEMNTRLQVEHPITEMVTGVDIVEQQIRIAQGDPLMLGDLSVYGSALECRIYAEDPANNFLPSPGLIQGMTEPGGPGVRNDTGVYAGFTIPIEYDPMISKLVTWGVTRDKAIERMLRALEEYNLMGIASNISYLRRIVGHPRFKSGEYDTHFIANHEKDLRSGAPAAEEPIALIAAGILSHIRKRGATIPDNASGSGMSPWKLSDRVGRFQR